MNEKLKIRLAELDVWRDLVNNLELVRKSSVSYLDERRESLSDDPSQYDLDYIKDLDRRIRAIDNVCAAILKQIG